MKTSQVYFLITLVKFSIQILNPDHMYNLSDDTQYQPCNLLDKDGIKDGKEVFKNLKQDLERITITGWVLLRGYHNTYHTIASIHEENKYVIGLSYHPSLMKYRLNLQSIKISLIDDSTMGQISWVFFSIYVYKVQTGPSNKAIYGGASVFKFTNPSILSFPEQSVAMSTIKLEPEKVQINMGWPSSSLGVTPSCSLTSNFNLFWNDVISDSDVFGLLRDPSNSLKDNLLFLDFQSHINNNYLYSKVGNQQKIDLNLNHFNPSILYSKEYISIDQININSKGFTMSFFFRILEINTNNLIIFRLYCLSVTLNIQVDKDQILSLFYIQLPTSPILLPTSTIQLNQWVQVICVIKQDFQIHGVLITKTPNENKITPFDFNSFQYSSLKLIFGAASDHTSFQLSYISLYHSALLSQTSICNYLITYKSGSHCLQCSSSYLLDFQNNNLCIYSPSQTGSIPGVQDYSHIQCAENMIQDLNSSKCACRKNFYLKDQQCERCPIYCDECLSGTQCISSRLGKSSETCPLDTFDDGLQCLQDYSYSIPIKINKVDQFNISGSIPNRDYDPTCSQSTSSAPYTINNDVMDLIDGDSFFYSFAIKFSQNTQTSNISYFENNGVILFSIQFLDSSTGYAIALVNGSNIEIVRFKFNIFEGFWISIWTDLKKGYFTLYTNSSHNSKYFDISSAPTSVYANPKICIGPCIAFSYPYFCGVIQSQPVVFIKNFVFGYNYNQLSYLLDLMKQQTKYLAYFVYSPSTPSTQIYAINQLDSTSSIRLNNINAGQTNKNIKGFALHNTFQTQIIDSTNNYEYPFSFSCSIHLESLTNKIQFLLQTINGQDIIIQLCPLEFLNSSFIQICYGNDCQDSKTCFLPLNQVNFLMVIFKNNSPFHPTFQFQEFEIVCNYHREKLLFFKYFVALNSSNALTIGSSLNTSNYLLYYNYFKLYQGDGYVYFNYDLTDRCFIYINLKNMQCIVPKRNFLFKGSDLISYEECLQLSIDGDTIYSINEYSKECINTQISSDYCIEYDLVNNICLSCRNLTLNASEFCMKCAEGYYLDGITKSCLICDQKCSQCSNSASNCTECAYKYSRNAPSCECQSYQYLNEDKECINCSNQCSTCEENEDKCITCTSRRIDPPTCECDQEFYITGTQNCDNIVCSEKCQTCTNDSFNCQICMEGRSNPPTCDCDENYYPSTNGKCLSCGSGQYYNSILQTCQKCSTPCTQCLGSSTNCIDCNDGTVLIDNICKCQSGEIGQYKNGDISCFEEMGVTLNLKLSNNIYQLEFNFDYDLQPIDFSYYNSSQIINLYFSQIQPSYFTLSEFKITKNILSTNLIVKSSFQTNQGSVLFPNTFLFTSISEKYALSSSYSQKPLTFNIGPFVLSQSDVSAKGIDNMLESVKDVNSNVLSFIQQFQLVFYILNTIQPTAMILLLNAQLPPNLYKFCQIQGLFVFPSVPDYQTNSYSSSFRIFGYQLDASDVTLTDSSQFKKLSFSNSLLINIPIIIIKQCAILLILGIISIAKSFNKTTPFKSKTDRKQNKFESLLINQIFSESEVNLLLLISTIFAQFFSLNEEMWAYRYGVYIACLEIIFIVLQLKYSIEALKQNKQIELLTLRIQTNNIKYSKYYFFFQMIKKYTVVIIIISGYNFPYLVTVSVAIIFLASCYSTILLKPYQKLRTRYIKIIGELLLSVTWMLLIPIVRFEQLMQKEVVISQKQFNLYVFFGLAIILLLSTFTLLFLLEFIFSLVDKLLQIIRPKFKKEIIGYSQKVQKVIIK